MIQNYSDYYTAVWHNCSVRIPSFAKRYPEKQKLRQEEKLDRFIKMIQSLHNKSYSVKKVKFDEEKFFRNTRIFFADGFDFEESELDLMFSDAWIGVTKSFVRQAREFDSELQFSEKYQACRNVWIMNGLQLILSLPVRLTPSIFAYSMLYPYTDNLMDNPDVSVFEKWNFSERFRERLSGKLVEPQNRIENAIYRLVGMIESQYSQTEFPDVFQSLLDIHTAQTDSLKLIHQKDLLSEKEIISICLNKGGASVLADGFLVAGKLTDEQRHFLFGYGAYLQLLDDVQDVREDWDSGLMTVFIRK